MFGDFFYFNRVPRLLKVPGYTSEDGYLYWTTGCPIILRIMGERASNVQTSNQMLWGHKYSKSIDFIW